MNTPTLFDPKPPDRPPGNDAAPGGAGAGVNGPNSCPNHSANAPPPVPQVRHDAPETSLVAADRIADHAGTLRAAVLAMLRERGDHGATDQEIQSALHLSSETEIPRRWELVNAGEVAASGRNRRTRSNRPAMVWVLSEFAPEPGEGGAR